MMYSGIDFEGKNRDYSLGTVKTIIGKLLQKNVMVSGEITLLKMARFLELSRVRLITSYSQNVRIK